MQIESIGGTPVAVANSTGQTASDAFGIGFEALLRIILTQLTYQDPLKPMENFEFVSQLAQFSQIQQGQVISDRLEQLVSAQATNQATGLLGKIVDVPSGGNVISGVVTGASFDSGTARLTIRTTDGQILSNIALSAVSQVREAQ